MADFCEFAFNSLPLNEVLSNTALQVDIVILTLWGAFLPTLGFSVVAFTFGANNMGRLHLKNIVLPAVLVSCATFSSFTLPFILSDSNPIQINLPPLFQGEVQPIFRHETKGAAIRHIGLAIVSSVSAGLLTIEVLRRMQPVEKPECVQVPDENAEYPIIDHIYHSSQSRHFHHDGLQDLAEAIESCDQVWRNQPLETDPLFIAAEEEFNLEDDRSEVKEGMTLTGTDWSFISPRLCNLIPVIDRNVQTCHIRTDASEHSQFALRLNQDYYRFVKVQSVREKALAIAQRLSNRGEQVVITEQDQGFFVWVKEHHAAVELVS
jgi:hypothetical protein